MTNSAVQILNLVSHYAELIDAGNFEGAAALFAHARVKTAQGEIGHRELLALWRDNVILYEDGTPRTKHVITNPIIEVDAGTATCRTYYTVMQQVGDDPLRPIICGRYHDRFERVEGSWRFCYRDYSLHDMPGDMTRHSRNSAWRERSRAP